jgi:hypothetical protein
MMMRAAIAFVALSVLVQAGPAPTNCRKISTDSDWPTVETWQTELKGIEVLMPIKKQKHPDYIYEATTVENVQSAVNFAVKHNVRLTIINSGHDFLGR